MLLQSSFYVFVGIVISYFTPCWTSEFKHNACGNDYYFSRRKGQCRRCSSCPMNKIIKRPCSFFRDVKCGPFNLEDFHKDNEGQDPYFYGREHTSKKPDRLRSKGGPDSDETNGPTTVEKEDQEYWKTLAFALIGLLSVLIIVATVVVLLACRKLQRAHVTKQPDDGDTDDADSGYVVIRAIRNNLTDTRPGRLDLSYYTKTEMDAHPPLLTSNYSESDSDPHSVLDPTSYPHPGRLCFLPRIYTPQRRLLNYYSDDVFEMDDNVAANKVAFKNKLNAIAEK